MQEQESPFDSFARSMTPESRRALDLAREEMLALSHWWLGTEHLLWGLSSEGASRRFSLRWGLRLSAFMLALCLSSTAKRNKANRPKLTTRC